MSPTLKLSGIVRESIVDGPGYRFVVFVQGCPHHCEGCHNPQTHSFEGGTVATVDELFAEILKNRHLKGVTLSGGEPFCQAAALSVLAEKCRENGLDVITYTGYTFEHLLSHAAENNGYLELLKATDILIDGKFDINKKSLLLKFRGSKNQRPIDVKESLKQQKAVVKEFD
ncbi:MAG: anaerobic ribonucleoside-triphosphate reductase activating protein [Clostridia bacterium]|nr:anaerobic ribonucleoside-triphosphate reductase activating protein [Clostridia bacterium]